MPSFQSLSGLTQHHHPVPISALEVGQIAVAGGAVLGIGAICYYGLGMSNEPGAIDRVV